MKLKVAESHINELLSMFYMGHTARTLQEQAQDAARNNLSHIEFLECILSQEASLRHQRVVKDRLTRAHLPVLKTIDTFDWAHPSAIPKQMVLNSLSLEFVDKKMNLILVGPSGVGKTHIALTLAYAACQKEIRTLWTTAADMLNTLTAAKADNSLMETIKHYASPKLLVIDELGFLPMDKDGSDLFFQIISHRYEQGSVVLTTNRAFKDWGKIFNDNTVAAAVLDRLVHHSEVAKIEGASYRVKNRKEQMPQAAE